jgi:hypothetical protein
LRCQCSIYHNKADSKPEGYSVLLNVPWGTFLPADFSVQNIP